MSLTTINTAANDAALQARISAGVWRETIGNPVFGATPFGQQVMTGSAAIGMIFNYPIAVDYEDEYAFAVDNNNPNPGGDPGVITDANIGASIQAHWPDEIA
jgi:hypothetical protein